MTKINYPLRSNEDAEVVDCFGNVVIPSFIFSNDYNHMVSKRELAKLVSQLLNAHSEIPKQVNPVINPNIPVTTPSNGGDEKKRGNPAFVKGQKNPYL